MDFFERRVMEEKRNMRGLQESDSRVGVYMTRSLLVDLRGGIWSEFLPLIAYQKSFYINLEAIFVDRKTTKLILLQI